MDDSEAGRKDKEERCGREGQRKGGSHETEGLGGGRICSKGSEEFVPMLTK